MPVDQVFSFSARDETARIINEYLDVCEKKGMKKSRIITNALMEHIKQEQQQENNNNNAKTL